MVAKSSKSEKGQSQDYFGWCSLDEIRILFCGNPSNLKENE